MEKETIARILAEAYHKYSTVNKWESLTQEERNRWLYAVDVLEIEADKL